MAKVKVGSRHKAVGKRKLHIEKYWMCKCDRVFLIPVFELAVDRNFWFNKEEKSKYTISFEIRFLKRWSAVEIHVGREVSND